MGLGRRAAMILGRRDSSRLYGANYGVAIAGARRCKVIAGETLDP
jgi:hypothetical protein